MIRPARPGDFDAVNDIMYEAFHFHHSKRFYKQKLDAGRLFVYEEEGEILGVADIIIEENCVYIALLAVKKAWRNKGIGSAFLKFAERLAKTHGKKYVVTHPDVRAIEYYLKRGFELVEKYENGKIEYIMKKFIQ